MEFFIMWDLSAHGGLVKMLHLQQGSWCVLGRVHHQRGAVPESQTIAQEDDEPHVPSEKAHDQTLSDSPALCGGQVPVVPGEEKWS